MRHQILLLLYFIVTILLPNQTTGQDKESFLVVLGVAQDGGFPQAGCKKSCCEKSWTNLNKREFVSCVAWVDPIRKKYWLFEKFNFYL